VKVFRAEWWELGRGSGLDIWRGVRRDGDRTRVSLYTSLESESTKIRAFLRACGIYCESITTTPHDRGNAMARAYINEDKRVSVPENGKRSKVITFKDDDSYEIAKKYWDDHSKRNIRQVVLHWGGLNPKDLIWRLTKMREDDGNTPVASHISIDKANIVQHGDFKRMGSHARGANRDSIGVDINQEGWRASKHTERGKIVKKIPNPIYQLDPRPYYQEVVSDKDSKHYAPNVLTLDPQTAQTLRDFLRDMNEGFGIPLEVPRNADGTYRYSKMSKEELANFNGILGHFHVSEEKYDPLPWWKDIFDPLFEDMGGETPEGPSTQPSGEGGGGGAAIALLLGAGALAWWLKRRKKKRG